MPGTEDHMPRTDKKTKGASSPPSHARSHEQVIEDVMTPEPKMLDAKASVRSAAELMRESDIGDVVVLENDRLCGILTDRDIVVRVLADGGNPDMITVGDICSRDLTVLAPTAPIDDAIQLIRERAIRRLPVVDDTGEVLGIVSIGDLAIVRDRKSALADVSAAPANT